jgi:hypothetical protein
LRIRRVRQLFDKKRVAVGAFDDSIDDVRATRTPAHRGGDIARGLFGEGAEIDAHRVARKVREQLGLQRARRVVPHCQYQQDRHAPQSLHHRDQKIAARGVDPVDIFDDAHQRLGRGARQHIGDDAEQRGLAARHAGRVQFVAETVEQLRPRRVRHGVLCVDASALHGSNLDMTTAEFLDEARLARSRFTGDDREDAGAVLDPIQGLGQAPKLGFAAEHRRTPRRHHFQSSPRPAT